MLLFITALTASDAPLKPKNIAISLSARWPATPLAAEAAEFMADEGLFYKFVEGMSTTTPATTDRAQLETIESVATNLLSPLGLRTLRAFLAAHVHSPRVEMWRQLSAAEATRLGVADPSSSWLSACDRAVAVGDDAAAVEAAIGKLLAEVAADASCQVAAKPEERALSTRAPLSVDHVHPSSAAPASCRSMA